MKRSAFTVLVTSPRGLTRREIDGLIGSAWRGQRLIPALRGNGLSSFALQRLPDDIALSRGMLVAGPNWVGLATGRQNEVIILSGRYKHVTHLDRAAQTSRNFRVYRIVT